MCGLVGFASATPVAQLPAWLEAGGRALAHRGPDAGGSWMSADGRAGFSHRRLSIIDLSSGGAQPMHVAEHGLTLAFNGEIYNFRELRRELEALGHRFSSHSDTEVLLAAYREWGSGCLARLDGMFAFALHDARNSRVLLARDRAGEKPMFYLQRAGELRFASELKALLADPEAPRRIDPLALDCYLAIGYVPGGQCILAGYRKLPPAHAALFDCRTGTLDTWRYWDLPAAPEDQGPGSDDALLAELESVLGEAVERQLVADVPLGVLLSGGVDSSLITAMASRSGRQVKTFTVGFSGFGSYDESGHARLIARHFGTEHIELQAGDATPGLLPVLARQFDEPIIDSSMLPTYLVSQLVREHCKVALGGDGGDELFGGYPHYGRLLALRERSGWIPAPLRRSSAAIAGRVLPVGFKGRNWLQALGSDLDRSLPLVAAHFDVAVREALTGSLPPLRAEAVMAARVPSQENLVERATRMDFANYMVEDILVKVDRASMLASLELRAPLLDRKVIEFAFGRVPARLKSTTHARKILLKRLAQKVLPQGFDLKRKQGFSVPLAHWLHEGPWRDAFHDVLGGDTIFRRPAVDALLRGQRAGMRNHERLFGLVVFELWRREYGCTL